MQSVWRPVKEESLRRKTGPFATYLRKASGERFGENWVSCHKEDQNGEPPFTSDVPVSRSHKRGRFSGALCKEKSSELEREGISHRYFIKPLNQALACMAGTGAETSRNGPLFKSTERCRRRPRRPGAGEQVRRAWVYDDEGHNMNHRGKV